MECGEGLANPKRGPAGAAPRGAKSGGNAARDSARLGDQ